MPLPNRSVRIAPEHADILNDMLDLLRAGRANDLRAMLRKMDAEPDQQPAGPFRNSQAALDFLISRIVFATHPAAVWLFGSRARGDARQSSDFDLMAIFSDEEAAHIDDLRSKMAEAVAGSGVGADVMACTLSDFEAFRDVAGSMIRTVHEEGREVYVSRAARRARHIS